MALRRLAGTQITGIGAASTAAIALPTVATPVADKASQGGNTVEFERKYRITNDFGSGTIYFRLGGSTVQAALTDVPVNPNNPVVVTAGFNETFIAFFGSTAAMNASLELVTGRNE